MYLPANRPRVAQHKFWCRFLKSNVLYEAHLVIGVLLEPKWNLFSHPTAPKTARLCASSKHNNVGST